MVIMWHKITAPPVETRPKHLLLLYSFAKESVKIVVLISKTFPMESFPIKTLLLFTLYIKISSGNRPEKIV